MRDKLAELERALWHGQHAAVLGQVDGLLEAAPPGSAESGRLQLLRAMALHRAGKVREAGEAQSKLIEACNGDGNWLWLRALLDRARVWMDLGELQRSADDVAAVEAAAPADHLLRGDMFFFRGLLHVRREETAAAQVLFEQALAEYQLAGDDYQMAEAHSALAMTLVKQGRNFEGINLWRKALVFFENEGIVGKVAAQLQRISFATWCEGDLEQTRRTLLHVLRLSEEEPDSLPLHFRMLTHYNLAGVELRAGDLELADFYLRDTQYQAERLDDKALLADLRIRRTVLEILRDQPEEALAAREAALRENTAIQLELHGVDLMFLALALAASGDLAGAQADWPAKAYVQPDGEQRMALRGVLQLLETLKRRTTSAAEVAQFAAWEEELLQLIGE